MNRFRISFDILSFILGFLLASVFWWAVGQIKPLIKQIRQNLKEGRTRAKERGAVGMEDRYRKLVLRQAEGMHVAASLFSLSEIVLQPRLLAPPPRVEPGSTSHDDDIVSQGLPYLPAWPEMAAIYRATSFPLAKALMGGTNIAVIGQPGTGKTVALAHLAIQVANRAPGVEHLHSMLPILIHVADLELPFKPKDLLSSFVETISDHVSMFDLNRTPKFVNTIFDEGRALLILDGVDELGPETLKQAAEYIKALIKAYPRLRVVTTGTTDFIDGFYNLGFAPLVVIPWNNDDQDKFRKRWQELWGKFVENESWAQSAIHPVDSTLLNRWLISDTTPLTPLEYTLKVWGVYAGDIRGPRPIDTIITHIRRLTPSNVPEEALQVLGMQTAAHAASIFKSSNAREWIKSFEPSEDIAEVVDLDNESSVSGETETKLSIKAINKDKKKATEKSTAAKASLLTNLAERGLLTTHRGNRMRFVHPVFAGYLAGQGLSGYNASEVLLSQPAWTGRALAMNYYAANNDATTLVTGLLAIEDELLQRGTLTAARLLRDSAKDAPWRGLIMTALIDLIRSDHPLALRGQAIAAIVLSGDPAGAALFRQFVQLPASDIRQLAVLGSGALRDKKAVDAILPLVNEIFSSVRHAACLALVSIGTADGLEAVASALLHGDEDQRRAAAEALANHPAEGYATLQEGSSAQDILMRRAVVYGLARLDEPWAVEILEKMQIEDQQWVVRNAAVEALESRLRPSSSVPKKLPPPHEAPWLIQFAGQFGMGIAPGAAATDMLLRALKSNNEEERLASLSYLRYIPTEGVISNLYNAYFGNDISLREAIFTVLWEISLSGIRMPAPQQFGLG